MQDYKNLTVWKKSHELALEVYRLTARTQDRNYPGLMSQLRRASASAAANIVEGCGHASQGEFARFLQMAAASALEVSYHLLLARDLGALDHLAYARLDAKTSQVRQMLGGLLRRVRVDLEKSRPEAARLKRTATEPRTANSEQRTA